MAARTSGRTPAAFSLDGGNHSRGEPCPSRTGKGVVTRSRATVASPVRVARWLRSAIAAIVFRPRSSSTRSGSDPANPRRHSKKQIRQIAESIKAFRFNVPILIDRHGNIIAGHGRWLACRDLGFTKVPTLCLNHLTPPSST